jgi:hypothetical protein
VTDHLPVVADYQTVGISPIPEPAGLTLLLVFTLCLSSNRPRRSR